MSQANLTLAWVIFVWIVFSTVVAWFIGNRCISIMLKHSDGTNAIPKKVPENLFDSNNLSFFLRFKPSDSDSIEFVQAAKK